MTQPWPASYLNTFGVFTSDSRSEKYAKALLDQYLKNHAGPPPIVVDLLDVCCGTGVMGHALEAHLQAAGNEVRTVFLDKSPDILNEIKPKPTDYLICGDVTAMTTIPEKSVDVAVCRYGFNNLQQEDWLTALGEVLRVVKPGGLFLLQDHFVPGPVFSALVNEAEQFLARMEGKTTAPFIFSTEVFNAILDQHPQVASRVKAGYSLVINIWDRLRAKRELIPDFAAAKREILRFYEEICLRKYQVLVVDPDEYIPAYNVTYAITKRQ